VIFILIQSACSRALLGFHSYTMNCTLQRSSKPFLFGLAMLNSLAAGQTVMAAPEEELTKGLSGLEVYNNVCIACHYPPGIGGAPSLGDNEVWSPRIAQGMDTLIEHALNGFAGNTGVMPKKGERLDLSDEEVIRAVVYIVAQVSE